MTDNFSMPLDAAIIEFLDTHKAPNAYNEKTDILVSDACKRWGCSYAKALRDLNALVECGELERVSGVILPSRRLGNVYRLLNRPRDNHHIRASEKL